MTRAKVIALLASGAFALTGISGIVATSPASGEIIKNYTYIPPEARGEKLWEYDAWAEPIKPWPWQLEKKWIGPAIPVDPNVLHAVSLEGQLCNSAALEPGVVQTEPTVRELGWINLKRKEVGLVERPASGALYAQFTCGEKSVELRGGMIGLVTPINKTLTEGQSLTDDVAVNPETGKAVYTHFEGGGTVALEMQVDGEGFHEVGVEDIGTFTPEEGTLKVKASKKLLQFEAITKKKKKGKTGA